MTRPRPASSSTVVETLHESEERYRFLTENIPVQVWTALPDGRLDYVSAQTARSLGLTPAQLLADGWRNVVHPEDLPAAVEKWTHALATGTNYEMQFRLKTHAGIYAWHLARAIPQRGPSGDVVRWFGTNTNIDDEREASRKLAEANTAKDVFLATVSHELRTPLNAILGWATLLRSGQLDPAGYLRAVETIERNAKSQARLIEDILDSSRIVAGNLHLEIRPLDMTVLVRTALDAVRPAAAAKNIQIHEELDPAAARIVGDPDRLQQVVWNLASNAIKFTPKGGSVRVRLERVASDIELRVEDTGEGIDPDFVDSVFEKFRQAEGSTTRRFGGLGLGLALVRYLVEAHGGTVRAESEGVGRGAVFRVRLPVQAVFAERGDTPHDGLASASPAVPPVLTNAPVPAPALEGVTVLVVDDDADARDLVATVLRANGAEVTTAPNALRALEALVNHPPMVLVSDVGMPGMDGYELVRRVRALGSGRCAALPAVALTAYSREEDRRLAMEAGFQIHVAKPVEPAELVRVVSGLAPRSGAS